MWTEVTEMLPETHMTMELMDLIIEGEKEALQRTMEELQPYDMHLIYQKLPDKHQTKFLAMLELEQIAKLLQEMDAAQQMKVLIKLGAEKSGKVLDLMDNDDLAAMFTALPPEKVEGFLSLMKQEESLIVKKIMDYPPDTAGRLMTNRFVWIPEHYTVRETVEKLKYFAEITETFNYMYVVDSERKLKGVISYRDLILHEEGEKIADLMFTRVISVSVLTDQEKVARLIERYDFLSMPVVDEEDKLVGIITVDDVIDVVIQEASEDIAKLSASGKDITFETKATVAAYRRLPWLILLLFIGLVSGTIISSFEETIEKVVALTFFMPMIAGMTGNTGTQSLAVVVRGLTTQTIDKQTVTRLILREFWVALIIGATCGLLISVIAFFWKGSMVLGFVVGSSLVLTLILGTLAGTVIPLILYRFNIDPAVASGPLITTLNDILSLFIYFGIATMFLTRLM
jgi:magnesium transporter